MIQEVKQWIDEIQVLQKKLTEAVQEREEAFASAAKWRSLYETEAKQRRNEASLARQNANLLKIEVQQLQELPGMEFEDNSKRFTEDRIPEVQQTSSQIGKSGNSVKDLKAKLMQAWVERDRLIQALKAEQTNHAQTRYALTTALGDTIENLTQERATRHQHEQAEVQRQTVIITHETVQPLPKSPSLALPPTNLAQSQS